MTLPARDDVLLRGGTVITVDDADRVFVGDVRIQGGGIVAVGPSGSVSASGARVVDVAGAYVIPGFVQAHVHLCQVLFRGICEDLPLLEWLERRIWPLEAAHDEETLDASVRLGLAELLLSGTTAALDMATVHHTAAVFRAAERAGFRLTSGKALMDKGELRPAGLVETTAESLAASHALADAWHGKAEGLLRYAYAPRFILSCTDEALRGVVDGARSRGCLIHSHASESPGEIAAVRAATGKDNIEALHALGMTGENVVLAHCVHASDAEIELLSSTGTRVAHCSSANLKLASGTARVPELLARGVVVGLGADGAPCNNRLSMFTEMRSASLLQKPRLGADAMPARDVLRLATRGGARALGIEQSVGSLEVGKRGDVVVVRGDRPHLRPAVDPFTILVHAAEAADVRHVFVDGRQLVDEGVLTTIDLARVLEDAEGAVRAVAGRAGIAVPA